MTVTLEASPKIINAMARELQQLGEALVNNPTKETYTRYRIAYVKLAETLEIPAENIHDVIVSMAEWGIIK